jgi:hypothetical protein
LLRFYCSWWILNKKGRTKNKAKGKW